MLKKCDEKGCSDDVLAKGKCSKHYQRMKRRSDYKPRKHERHGMRNTPTYRSWSAMRNRCEKPKDSMFYRYGGRGIKVCERWMSFPNFLDDMGERPEGMTLDRIDSDSDYSPENCTWATRKEQNRNKPNNRMLTIYGLTMCLAEWAEIVAHETRYDTIKSRLNRGWSDKEAVFGKAVGVAC